MTVKGLLSVGMDTRHLVGRNNRVLSGICGYWHLIALQLPQGSYVHRRHVVFLIVLKRGRRFSLDLGATTKSVLKIQLSKFEDLIGFIR